MTAADSAAQLVARFLRANHYNETLEAFLREAGLPEDAGSLGPGAWTIEQILQEKLQFDVTVNFEKQGKNEKQGWTQPSPTEAHEPPVDVSANVLCVSGDVQSNYATITTADRSWKRFSAADPFSEDDSVTIIEDSPVLSVVFVSGRLVLATSMSGQLSLRKADTYSLIDQCRHHTKYTVQVISHYRPGSWLIATAAWDQRIHIYAPNSAYLDADAAATNLDDDLLSSTRLGDPVHTISLTSNPESMTFVRHPDTDKLYLIVSRRDSTHLYYYRLHSDDGKVVVCDAGRQNLAPHSNAWVAFTPCSLALCPNDQTLLAVATSHIPHMKVIIVRLLFPGSEEYSATTSTSTPTQASVARAELAKQDREDAAISIQVSTMAPQTPYSTPQVVWRPDGTGVFVNGDDGAIRGVEAATGKVISVLKGHDPGSKVRTLWAGSMASQLDGQKQEILLSGGFDKKLLLWTFSRNPA